MAQVTIEESVWSARVVSATAAGARAEGDSLPVVPISGIRFSSQNGKVRFLAMQRPLLPTQQQLDAMSLDELINLHSQAKPVRPRAS